MLVLVMKVEVGEVMYCLDFPQVAACAAVVAIVAIGSSEVVSGNGLGRLGHDRCFVFWWGCA